LENANARVLAQVGDWASNVIACDRHRDVGDG
jgi:hypothetical protein